MGRLYKGRKLDSFEHSYVVSSQARKGREKGLEDKKEVQAKKGDLIFVHTCEG